MRTPVRAFRAERSSAWSANRGTTVAFDLERFDYGDVYNPTLGVFTAPVAGLYLVNWRLSFTNNMTTANWLRSELMVNRTGAYVMEQEGHIAITGQITGTGPWESPGTALLSLAAGNQASIRNNAGSSFNTDLATAIGMTFFDAVLLERLP